MGLAEFTATNAFNVATGYSSSYLSNSDHPLVKSVIQHDGCVLHQIEAVQIMVGYTQTVLEEAQANFTVA